jgi:membrane-associated protease RseP (regulator of RpoE activity)
LLKLLAYVGVLSFAAFYFRVGRGPVLAFLMFTLLLLAYNLVQLLVGWAFGVRATEFALYFGFPVARLQVGTTTFRINWLPLGGYVGFNPAPPLRAAKSGRDGAARPLLGFTQLHPVRRALVAVSAPLFMGIVAVLLLAPDGVAIFLRDVVAEFTSRFKGQAGPLPFHSFLAQFADPAGIVTGTGQLATVLAVFNVLPVPGTSGGFAVGQLLSWARRGRPAATAGTSA